MKTIDKLFSLRMLSLGVVASNILFATNPAAAQHFLTNSRMPTGELGRFQVAQRPELSGVLQPVLLKVPEGATVAVAEGAGFAGNNSNATLVGLQVGSTYRIRVGNVPNLYGDVYATVEMLDRMHAPPGKETRYPIPIELTQEELGLALRGKFVTRVIYVEDPKRALGVRDVPDQQRYFEVMAHEDPLHVASRLGRPVAILRMGSLAPSSSGLTSEFLLGSPPIQQHAMLLPHVPYVPNKLDASDLPAADLKREELPNAPPQPVVDGGAVNIAPDPPEKSDGQDEVADDDELEKDGDIFGGTEADPVDPPAENDAGLDDDEDPFGDESAGDDEGDPFNEI